MAALLKETLQGDDPIQITERDLFVMAVESLDDKKYLLGAEGLQLEVLKRYEVLKTIASQI